MIEKLPDGWEATTFGAIFDFKGGNQPPKSEFSNSPQQGYVRLLQIRDFESDDLAVYIRNSDRWPKCEEHDLMIGRYGASVGKILTGKAGAYNVALVRMIFDRENLDSKWVRCYLNSDLFQQPLRLLSRSAQNGFNKEELEEFELALPPIAEQRRIVAKIEELTARSRAARAALAEVPTLLEQFRQSVLASAFRGDLTADWRVKHPQTEPASELLARVRIERRKQWEAKYPKKKYVEPEPVDDTDLPELPEGWCWAVMDEVGHVQLGRQRSPQYHDGANMRPYLRVMNVFENRIDTSDIMQMVFDPDDFERYKLEIGDILLNEGQSAELVGRPAIYRGEVPNACFTNTLVRFRCIDAVVPEYALGVFLHYLKNGRFQQIASLTVNIAHLGAGRFSKLEFPVPPMDEQRVIVKRVFNNIESIDNMRDMIGSLENELDQLDQSIMAKAFRGELVPQDPADEPASVLLARLRGESAVTLPVQQGRVIVYILLLLRSWKKPLSREMLERGLVLMLNADARRAILGRSKPTTKRKKAVGTPPHYVPGIDYLLGEMIDDGLLVPGPEAGFFAEGNHGRNLNNPPTADLAALKETIEAMKAILKDKHQAMDAEFASVLHGETYELVP